MSPYTQKDIEEALKQKSPHSAPGDDQILYDYLKKMPSTHNFLATLFTGIRDTSVAPDAWSSSKIILIPKDTEHIDTSNPSSFRMISLTANIGKLYHTLESTRTLNFMINNKYLDPSAQKAYIQGINGCVEHVQVIQEVIQDAKFHKKTVHITWVDLIDAFGSLSHMLINHVLLHYHLPTQIIKYIADIYSKLKGRIKTKDWESDIIEFLRGAFQGDPYSGVIFLIAFNPLIEHIKKYKESQGYAIKHETEAGTEETKVVTTPFADDFNLISNDKIKHQKLITEVEEKAKDMGFQFKPSKCRSLSICGGKSTPVSFVLTDPTRSDVKVPMDTVHDNPHKFLGSLVTHTNRPKE